MRGLAIGRHASQVGRTFQTQGSNMLNKLIIAAALVAGVAVAPVAAEAATMKHHHHHHHHHHYHVKREHMKAHAGDK